MIANFMLELLILMIVNAFNQIWTILKLDQTGGKFPLTLLSVNPCTLADLIFYLSIT